MPALVRRESACANEAYADIIASLLGVSVGVILTLRARRVRQRKDVVERLHPSTESDSSSTDEDELDMPCIAESMKHGDVVVRRAGRVVIAALTDWIARRRASSAAEAAKSCQELRRVKRRERFMKGVAARHIQASARRMLARRLLASMKHQDAKRTRRRAKKRIGDALKAWVARKRAAKAVGAATAHREARHAKRRERGAVRHLQACARRMLARLLLERMKDKAQWLAFLKKKSEKRHRQRARNRARKVIRKALLAYLARRRVPGSSSSGGSQSYAFFNLHEYATNEEIHWARLQVEHELFYKTTDCMSWTAVCGCPYSRKCRFRHPSEKLRPRPTDEHVFAATWDTILRNRGLCAPIATRTTVVCATAPPPAAMMTRHAAPEGFSGSHQSPAMTTTLPEEVLGDEEERQTPRAGATAAEPSSSSADDYQDVMRLIEENRKRNEARRAAQSARNAEITAAFEHGRRSIGR